MSFLCGFLNHMPTWPVRSTDEFSGMTWRFSFQLIGARVHPGPPSANSRHQYLSTQGRDMSEWNKCPTKNQQMAFANHTNDRAWKYTACSGLEQKKQQMQASGFILSGSSCTLAFVACWCELSFFWQLAFEAQWEMERKQFITHIACCRAGSSLHKCNNTSKKRTVSGCFRCKTVVRF